MPMWSLKREQIAWGQRDSRGNPVQGTRHMDEHIHIVTGEKGWTHAQPPLSLLWNMVEHEVSSVVLCEVSVG